MYDGVVFAHGFFDWVTVAPLGVRTGALRPVSDWMTCVFIVPSCELVNDIHSLFNVRHNNRV